MRRSSLSRRTITTLPARSGASTASSLTFCAPAPARVQTTGRLRVWHAVRAVQELLKFEMRHGRPYVLVRWTGLEAAGDTWEPLDTLTNCDAAIAAFEHATGRRSLCRRPGEPASAARRRRRRSRRQASRSFGEPASAARRCRRRAPADPADRLHVLGGAARRPWCGAGGQDCALLLMT